MHSYLKNSFRVMPRIVSLTLFLACVTITQSLSTAEFKFFVIFIVKDIPKQEYLKTFCWSIVGYNAYRVPPMYSLFVYRLVIVIKDAITRGASLNRLFIFKIFYTTCEKRNSQPSIYRATTHSVKIRSHCLVTVTLTHRHFVLYSFLQVHGAFMPYIRSFHLKLICPRTYFELLCYTSKQHNF